MAFALKGNIMHHKYDSIWKDVFPNAHIAAVVYFLKKLYHKQRGLKDVKFLSAQFSSSLGSRFLLFWLNYLLPTQHLAAYTYQCKKEEKWA